MWWSFTSPQKADAGTAGGGGGRGWETAGWLYTSVLLALSYPALLPFVWGGLSFCCRDRVQRVGRRSLGIHPSAWLYLLYTSRFAFYFYFLLPSLCLTGGGEPPAEACSGNVNK
ncbi:unnamed protein product, partial [Ectocarpus sp. 12 AP-2014]